MGHAAAACTDALRARHHRAWLRSLQSLSCSGAVPVVSAPDGSARRYAPDPDRTQAQHNTADATTFSADHHARRSSAAVAGLPDPHRGRAAAGQHAHLPHARSPQYYRQVSDALLLSRALPLPPPPRRLSIKLSETVPGYLTPDHRNIDSTNLELVLGTVDKHPANPILKVNGVGWRWLALVGGNMPLAVNGVGCGRRRRLGSSASITSSRRS